MKNEKLKCCPMCGNPYPDIYNVDSWTDYDCWSVKCPECGLEMNDYHSEQDAIDAWNQRASDTCDICNVNDNNVEHEKEKVNENKKVNKPLLPCPFCGDEPYTRINVKVGNYGTTQVCLKIKCRCGISKEKIINSDISFDNLLDGIVQVEELWNDRVPFK